MTCSYLSLLSKYEYYALSCHGSMVVELWKRKEL
jgi:hypothetical protein